MHNRYREEEKEELMQEKETAPENKNQEEDAAVEVEIEVENLEDFKKLQEEVKRLNDLYLRTLAEAENFKRRINEERIRERKYGAQSLLEKLVAVVDIFDKAVNVETDDEKLKNFLIGFEMINKQLAQILVDEGIKKIETKDQKFDPLYHHAIEIEYQEGVEDNIILEEVQTGYMFKDRVLRPALVKVNKINKEEKEDV
ncbi:MAG: nucleotide exchange factor GrpE [Bacilli bacterium]|jgi:molecular chaperone GrpE